MFYHRIKLHSRNCKVISITIFSMYKFYVHPIFKASSLDKAIEYAKKNGMVVTKNISIIEYTEPNIEYLVLYNSSLKGKFSTNQEAENFVKSLRKDENISFYTFEPSEKRRNKARKHLELIRKMKCHDYVLTKDDSFESDLEKYVYSKEFHEYYQKIIFYNFL